MKISKEVKVGFLVTGALAALLWGMNYLKGIDVFSGANIYYAVYPQVDGLTPSSDVILNGVKVGQVQNIEFINDNSGRILTTLRVSRKVFVSKTSVARIVSSDLLGGRAMNIILDPTSAPAENGDTLHSEVQTTLSDQVMPIKNKAENLIESIDSLASSINEILGSGNKNSLKSSFENIDQTLQNLQSASRNLDMMLAPDKGKLSRMINNMESITSNIRNNNEALGSALKNISSITDSLAKSNLTTTINNASSALGQASDILEKIKKGEGTMGMLVNNDSLYNALQQSATDLDKLLVDLKQNPKRYVHISLFGGKAK